MEEPLAADNKGETEKPLPANKNEAAEKPEKPPPANENKATDNQRKRRRT